eukprot:SAG22_NODE_1106_length_5552_cov_3.049331_3_plen_39_part_00
MELAAQGIDFSRYKEETEEAELGASLIGCLERLHDGVR